MKQRVADYIADFLAEHHINDIFSVVGGGAMHLNDAFGHHKKLRVTYNHHEQASAMAAEAYARIDNKIAAVCVTTGPGAANAVTGAVCGYMDSIPMLIFSGQVRYSTTVYYSGLNLRTRGIQEFDIVNTAKHMTKYADIVTEPQRIRYHLEKALYIAGAGRPGPCWLDVPLDIQGSIIDTNELIGFEAEKEKYCDMDVVCSEIIKSIRSSERPVIIVGNGVRLSGAHDDFVKLVKRLKVPVVTTMSSIDAVSSDDPFFAGRCGTTGDRAGNFAVQNSDLLISFGSRLGFFQTGFLHEAWARKAYKIVCDIDPEELKKDSVNADYPVNCNAADLIRGLMNREDSDMNEKSEWVTRCQDWRKKYPVVTDLHRKDDKPNIYVFYDDLTKRLDSNTTLLVSCGTARVVGSQAANIIEGMRFITNPSTAAMGYDLPPAIGLYRAAPERDIVLVTGEGSLQMNLQELQTIVHNKIPVKIFVLNNGGYHSIRMTQNTFFKPPIVGVGEESGDLSFPDLSKLIPAYGIDFKRCEKSDKLIESIEWVLNNNKACVCELMLSSEQKTEPKSASKRMTDGRMVSAPLEDMAPFLSREELKENMYIPLWEELERF